jgi:hypothetical protein
MWWKILARFFNLVIWQILPMGAINIAKFNAHQSYSNKMPHPPDQPTGRAP